MAEAGVAAVRDTPAFRVKMNGTPLPKNAANDVLRVKSTDYVEGISHFELLVNIWDPLLQKYIWIDEQEFAEGNKVTLEIGFINNMEIAIEGEITGLEPMFHEHDKPVMRVHGYDLLHRLHRGRLTRSFTETTDSELASIMAGEAGLGSNVEDTNIRHDYLLQNNQTNYEYLKERADRLGFEPFVKDSNLLFRPKSKTHSDPVKLKYGSSIRYFYPILTTLDQVSQVTTRGWDPMTKQPITATAGSGDVVAGTMSGSRLGSQIAASAFSARTDTLVRIPIFSQSEAQQIAAGNMNERSLAFIRGEALIIGTPKLKAGDLVDLQGLGDRFSGNYYVTSAIHIVNKKGYSTHIKVERTAT